MENIQGFAQTLPLRVNLLALKNQQCQFILYYHLARLANALLILKLDKMTENRYDCTIQSFWRIMMMQIDRQSGMPTYLQIVEQIENLIAVGKLQPGEQLPTIRQLAVDLGVNRNTVAHAYKELNKEGVISTRRGLGSFVSDQPDQLPLAQRRREMLASMFSKPFVQALSLGYSMREIEEAVIEQLTRWWTETQSPNPPAG
jgi:GntR family transcriptional regulator